MKWIILLIAIVVLISMLMPASMPDCGNTDKVINGNNLKQIVTMMIKQRADTRETWPNPWQAAGVDFPIVNNGEKAMLVTAAIFEYLASKYNLAPELFIDPWHTEMTLDRSKRTAQEIVDNPNPLWAACYALDWSAPKIAGTLRPIISNRYPTDNHICMVYADAHRSGWDDVMVKMIEPSPAIRTQHSKESKTQWSAVINENDDIFSPYDGGELHKPEASFKFADQDAVGVWMK